MSGAWPTSNELTFAVLRVLSRSGGIEAVEVIDREVIKELKLSDSQLQIMRSGKRSEIQYRLAWVRTKAKQKGLITKEPNRKWKITEQGRQWLLS